MKRIIKSQIENMDKAYHNDCVQQARKQQQQLISKHPKQRYLFHQYRPATGGYGSSPGPYNTGNQVRA
jgi:hypothetical protein